MGLSRSNRTVNRVHLRLRVEELEPRIAPVVITNGVVNTDPNYFDAEILEGGSCIHHYYGIAHEGAHLGTTQVMYEYFGYLDLGGTVYNFYDNSTVPVLEDGKAVCDVTINPAGGGSVNVHVVSEIAQGVTSLLNTYTFTANGVDLRNARFTQYLDSDISADFETNVLTVSGGVAGNDLILYTRDQASAVRIAQLLGPPLSAATVTGWGADKFADLRDTIIAGGYNPAIGGTIDTSAGNLPPGTFAGIGDGYGPQDVTTAIVYGFSNASSAMVRTVLGTTYVSPDTQPPVVESVAVTNITAPGGTTQTFAVTYSDNLAINVGALESFDVRVTGPGFDQLATFVGVNNAANGTPRTATYRIDAPGGTWDSPDGGYYTLSMQPNQVADTAGNFVASGNIGGFQVQLGNQIPLPYRFQDDDGTWVTVRLKGPGTGFLTLRDDRITWAQIDTIVLQDTTRRSTLEIKTRGGAVPGTTLENLYVDGAPGSATVLNRVAAKDVDVVEGGSIQADGGIKSMVLRNIWHGTSVSIAGSLGSFTMRETGAGLNVAVAGDLGKFNATYLGWGSQVIATGSISSFTVHVGVMYNTLVAADGGSIGKASLGGGVSGSVIRARDSIGPVRVYGNMEATSIAADIAPGADGKYGTVDDVLIDGSLRGAIRSLVVTGALTGPGDDTPHYGVVAHGTIGSSGRVSVDGVPHRLPWLFGNITVARFWR